MEATRDQKRSASPFAAASWSMELKDLELRAAVEAGREAAQEKKREAAG
uniref:Uncharacterized protein n=1 Tax=Arundo donax TaxID=35708 RepID=A0A0A9HKN6_ARUDO